MKLFFGFALQEFTASAMYQFEFWMELLGSLAHMYGVFWLWNTLYRQKPELFSTTLDQMLTYAILAMILDGVWNATHLPRYYLNRQVRTGAIQMDLLRPLDFPFQLMARSVGMFIFLAGTQGVVGTLVGVMLLGVRGPASPAHALLFVLSLILAFVVGVSMNFLVGLISVVTIGVTRISWVYFSLLSFFSGQIIPLWLFPRALAVIVSYLPFQALVGIPVSIYIGRFSIPEAVQQLGLQGLWAVGLYILGRFAWKRAYTRLAVQGG